MTAILTAALPSSKIMSQRRRPTTISSNNPTSPIWQRGKSPSKKSDQIVDELSGLLLSTNNPSTQQKFSKGAHRFPVELALDSPDCNSEASTSSSLDSTASSTQILLPNSQWQDQQTPTTDILLRPNRHLLRSEPHEIDALRRWSAMSIASQAPDVANCDCTTLAFAVLRSSARRRQLKHQNQQQKGKNDESYRKVSGTNGNFSTDSGLGSSSGSEDSQSQAGNLTPMANKPPLVRKRRKRGMSLLAMMRRMFDGDRKRTQKSYGQALVAPSPSANDLGGFSPKWRGDDLNEASPLQRLSLDATPVTVPTNFRDEKLYGNAPNSTTAQLGKPFSTSNKPQQQQPIRNGSPLNNEKPNATIDGSHRLNAIPQQQQPYIQQKQQPQKTTLSSTLVGNKVPVSSSTFGTVPAPSLSASTTFNASPLQRPIQNRSPHALPHQQVQQRPVAAKPQRPNIAGRLSNCPQFHYPSGRPVPRAENDAVREKVRQLFSANTTQPQQLEYKDMEKLCQAIGFAVYSKRAVYEACLRLSSVQLDPSLQTLAPLTFNQFNNYWQLMTIDCHDEASRFIFTLAAAATGEKKPRNYLVRDDFFPMLLDLIFTYPGLSFLVNSTQFHSKYCEVVIVRIFWNVNRSWTGRITAHELRRSDFLQTLHVLETVVDINKVTDFFSYEHFYVAYCMFWQLDTDHDMVINREDMRNHCNGAITDVVIDRIFSGAVMRNVPKSNIPNKGPCRTPQTETIGFEDFVAFLLAEEDKKHPTSQQYWFRIIDLDGDGKISLYEMEYFYREIERKLTQHNFDTLAFRDVACNLFDSIAPSTSGYVTLAELRKCGLAHRFFNTFVNYLKYLEQESSEGERASVRTSGDKELSDWDQFCAMEYEILMSENDADYTDENIDVVLDDDEDGMTKKPVD